MKTNKHRLNLPMQAKGNIGKSIEAAARACWLNTKDEAAATTLLNAKNESFRQPILNVQIARAYLSASDPALMQRTWQNVMEQIQTHGKESADGFLPRIWRCLARRNVKIKIFIRRRVRCGGIQPLAFSIAIDGWRANVFYQATNRAGRMV